MKTITNFINSISPKGTTTLLTDFHHRWPLTLEQVEEFKSQRGIHFCPGIKLGSKSRKKKNIVGRNFFVIDLDLRKNLYENSVEPQHEIMGDSELMEIAKLLKIKLYKHSAFSDWRYIVWSWNGLHIYFVGDTINSAEKYEEAVTYIYSLFDQEVMSDIKFFDCDKSCNSINHTFRLPWSINRNRMKYGLKQEPSKILWEQEGMKSELLADTIEYLDLFPICNDCMTELLEEESFIEKLDEDEIYVANWCATVVDDKTLLIAPNKKASLEINLYEYILDNISVAEMFMNHSGLEMQRDGRNFKSKKDWENIGVFYDYRKNLLIPLDGNSYLQTRYSGLNPRTFAKDILWITTNKELFQYFIDNYPDVADIQKQNQDLHRGSSD